MSGLPVRKDGRLYSGRPAAVMLQRLLDTEWSEGLPSLGSRGIEEGMIRNEIETLAKQRDGGYALAHSTLTTSRALVQAVAALLPVLDEEGVPEDVRFRRVEKGLRELVAHFEASGLMSSDIDNILKTMDDPWQTRAEPAPADTVKVAEAREGVLEGYDGEGTGVCVNCSGLIRRFSPEDAWHHVVTGSLGCA